MSTLKLCPQCKRLSVEYDFYHHVEKCLNKECNWVNRDNVSLDASISIHSSKLSITLEQRYLKELVKD